MRICLNSVLASLILLCAVSAHQARFDLRTASGFWFKHFKLRNSTMMLMSWLLPLSLADSYCAVMKYSPGCASKNLTEYERFECLGFVLYGEHEMPRHKVVHSTHEIPSSTLPATFSA